MTNQTPSNSVVTDLLPCPFCGESDTFVERADYSSCYVICNHCGARGPTSCNVNDEDCAAEDAGMEPGENAARRLWDTRQPASRSPAVCGYCRAEYATFEEARACAWRRHGERPPEDKSGFRAITPTSPGHAAVLADLARRIDDE